MKKLLTGVLLGLLAVCSIAGEVDFKCWAGEGTVPGNRPTEFEVRWLSSTGASGTKILPADACEWRHTNLEPGQSITYQTYSVNPFGYSDPSEPVTVPIHPKAEVPPNTMQPPIYLAPTLPLQPGSSFSCSGNITCTSQ